MLSRRGVLIAGAVAAALATGALIYTTTQRPKHQTLSFLCWSGYDDPTILAEFEKDTGIKVQYKAFVGGDAMFSLLSSSTNTYDVVTVDPEYIGKLDAAGRLSTLNPADYDLSQFLPTFRDFPLTNPDGRMVAIPVQFGANALIYNTEVFSAEEVESYQVLLSEKARGKIGVWDWYLPIMGVVSKAEGNATPYDIDDAAFARTRDLLLEMGPRMSLIAANFPQLTASLASGETLLVPGGAGFLTAGLQAQGKPVDWIVPKEGGIMWVDSLVIPTDAPNKEAAKRFVQWMTTPKAQAMLAGKTAFAANVPNGAAYALMSPELRASLKTDTAEEADALAARLSVRTLPIQQTERIWQDAWEQFKARK